MPSRPRAAGARPPPRRRLGGCRRDGHAHVRTAANAGASLIPSPTLAGASGVLLIDASRNASPAAPSPPAAMDGVRLAYVPRGHPHRVRDGERGRLVVPGEHQHAHRRAVGAPRAGALRSTVRRAAERCTAWAWRRNPRVVAGPRGRGRDVGSKKPCSLPGQVDGVATHSKQHEPSRLSTGAHERTEPRRRATARGLRRSRTPPRQKRAAPARRGALACALPARRRHGGGTETLHGAEDDLVDVRMATAAARGRRRRRVSSSPRARRAPIGCVAPRSLEARAEGSRRRRAAEVPFPRRSPRCSPTTAWLRALQRRSRRRTRAGVFTAPTRSTDAHASAPICDRARLVQRHAASAAAAWGHEPAHESAGGAARAHLRRRPPAAA